MNTSTRENPNPKPNADPTCNRTPRITPTPPDARIITALLKAGYSTQIAPGMVNGVLLARVLRVSALKAGRGTSNVTIPTRARRAGRP
jgi:hypothetical protein